MFCELHYRCSIGDRREPRKAGSQCSAAGPSSTAARTLVAARVALDLVVVQLEEFVADSNAR